MTTLEPHESGHLRFKLARDKTHRLVVEVSASEEIEVVLWRELDAMREESERAGRVGHEYAFAKGRRFSMHTTDQAPGGYWLVAIENLSGFKTDLSVRAWAETLRVP